MINQTKNVQTFDFFSNIKTQTGFYFSDCIFANAYVTWYTQKCFLLKNVLQIVVLYDYNAMNTHILAEKRWCIDWQYWGYRSMGYNVYFKDVSQFLGQKRYITFLSLYYIVHRYFNFIHICIYSWSASMKYW